MANEEKEPVEVKETKKYCPFCDDKTNSMAFVDDGKTLGLFCVNCVVRLLGAAVPDRRRFAEKQDDNS